MRFTGILIIILLHGCYQSPNKQIVADESPDNVEIDSTTKDTTSVFDLIGSKRKAKRQEDDSLVFDYSLISGNAGYYIQEELDSLRFPVESDYDEYYHNGAYRSGFEGSLPFYCSGYYNSDSIMDYAAVLIKDTTDQYVIAIISVEDFYEHYFLHSAQLANGESQPGMYISLLISTESDSVAEHILGTYYIDNESIGISDMNNSRGYWSTWSNDKNQFIDLLFD